jgi:hypothetical protein
MTLDAQMIVVVVVVAVAALLVVWWLVTSRRKQLKAKFGPEYDRAVRDAGNPLRAESELQARAKRVARYQIRPLTRDEHYDFSERWRYVQAKFVDDPGAAVSEADVLVGELMNVRGYPVSDFAHRVEDVSVDHANVVHHYREAHGIAERHARQDASTEELRQAVIHYRVLFDDLLEVRHLERKRA